jgi:hypothetical protein
MTLYRLTSIDMLREHSDMCTRIDGCMWTGPETSHLTHLSISHAFDFSHLSLHSVVQAFRARANPSTHLNTETPDSARHAQLQSLVSPVNAY